MARTPGAFQTKHMNKILSFGRSCKAYFRLYRNQSPNVKLCCQDCGRTLHKHGSYLRWVTGKRERIQLPIYRWLCPHCGVTVSLLPDFLVPWARFTTWVREAAIVRKRQGRSFRRIAETITTPVIGLSRNTVKRWWKRYLIQAATTSLWIASQLTAAGDEADLLHLHPKPVNASPIETALWLEQLQKRYTSEQHDLRGYWSFINTRAPYGHHL